MLAVWHGLLRNRRLLLALAALLAALAAVNLANRFGPVGTGTVLGPAAAAALVAWARWRGLTWHDLGLARKTWTRGLKYAAIAAMAVAAVYLSAVAWPTTRDMFLDSRYQLALGTTLLTALVIIPVSTVLLEEVAFRGVLLGWLGKHKGLTWAIAVSSIAFGLWHVLPSLGLSANQFVVNVVGSGVGAQAVTILAVVTFTAVAGWVLCEVRRRSGSLFAAVGLHWAVNGIAVLLTSAMWAMQTA